MRLVQYADTIKTKKITTGEIDKEKKRWLKKMQECQLINQSKSKNDDTEILPPTPERKYLFELATIKAVMRRLSEQRR